MNPYTLESPVARRCSTFGNKIRLIPRQSGKWDPILQATNGQRERSVSKRK